MYELPDRQVLPVFAILGPLNGHLDKFRAADFVNHVLEVVEKFLV